MGGYIMDMRKRVGHIPLIQCGASVILENERGEVLLQRRSDNGEWAYSGGSVELYESVEEAAARELFEETGLIADELEMLGIFSGEKMAFTYPNGDMVSNVDIVFVCRKYHGELLCEKGEVEELHFFPIDALPTPFFMLNSYGMDQYIRLCQSQKRDKA